MPAAIIKLSMKVTITAKDENKRPFSFDKNKKNLILRKNHEAERVIKRSRRSKPEKAVKTAKEMPQANMMLRSHSLGAWANPVLCPTSCNHPLYFMKIFA